MDWWSCLPSRLTVACCWCVCVYQPLYGHSYINPHTVCLGFGDGTLQLHDMRMRRW